jgi:hypothetical protein
VGAPHGRLLGAVLQFLKRFQIAEWQKARFGMRRNGLLAAALAEFVAPAS